MLLRPAPLSLSPSNRRWRRDRTLGGKVPPSSPPATSSAGLHRQGSERQPPPRLQRLPPTSLQPLPACHLLRRERVPPRHRKPATPVGPKPSIEEPPASRAPAHFLPELRSLHRASARWTDDPEGRAACPELAILAQETKTLHSHRPRATDPAKHSVFSLGALHPENSQLSHAKVDCGPLHSQTDRGATRTCYNPISLLQRLADVTSLSFFERDGLERIKFSSLLQSFQGRTQCVPVG